MILDTFQDIIDNIKEQLLSKKYVVIAVCGGSCTRKSTLVSAYIKSHFKDDAIVIAQDRFQKQQDYLDNVHPVYLWDHPDNFGIEMCKESILALKNGRETLIPNYAFKKDEPITYSKVQPAKVIVFEGLYTNFDILREINDLSIYVKSRWYTRMIRRVLRNTMDRYKGRAKDLILEGFVGSVTSAHLDFVARQESYSDFIVVTDLEFDKVIAYYGIKAKALPSLGETVLAIECENMVRIEAARITNSEMLNYTVFYKDVPYISFNITSNQYQKLSVIRPMSF